MLQGDSMVAEKWGGKKLAELFQASIDTLVQVSMLWATPLACGPCTE